MDIGSNPPSYAMQELLCSQRQFRVVEVITQENIDECESFHNRQNALRQSILDELYNLEADLKKVQLTHFGYDAVSESAFDVIAYILRIVYVEQMYSRHPEWNRYSSDEYTSL